ncbi:ChaN family lipoprotein [Thalassovita aquimarina]|uniref:ChaN family lipoprotein n=1 Tax=Thalassovita aquimarina TaxID=2785917 RepID=UPI003569BBB9
MKKPLLFALTLAAVSVLPGTAPAGPVEDLLRWRDVVILGEVHDNPAHHETQARLARAVAPKALVFEMLSPDQAGRITDDLRADREALADTLDWENSGWPDFSMYYQIMQAAPEAAIYGAGVPRDAARAAFEAGIVESFGADAASYGLDRPLPDDQLEARLDLQRKAHCDALPEDLLPKMVALQRLRDAEIARTTLRALTETGGPVVVITGNGHARTDWAVPAYLKQLQPGLALSSIGQSEDGNDPEGSFDAVIDAPSVDRPDPCAAFR